MKKQLWMLMFCAFLVLATVFSAAATAETPYDSSVYDRANLMSNAEASLLIDAAADFYRTTGCHFVLYTYSNPDSDDNFVGEDFFEIFGEPKDLNLVLLILKEEGSSYYYDLYLYGEAERLITVSEVDVVLDDNGVYPNLKSGKAFAGTNAFLQVSAREMTNDAVRVSPFLRALPVAAALGVIAAVITCVMVKRQYSMRKKSVDYPLEHFAKLELTEQSDRFAGSFVTTRVIQSNSGRSGGGGSRGGGRGHAGGR